MTTPTRPTDRGLFRPTGGSLRNKLLLTLTLLSLVPLVFFSVVSYELTKQWVEKNRLSQVAALAREKETQAIALTEKNLRLLEAAASGNLVRDRLRRLRDGSIDRDHLRAELTASLKDLLATSPEIDAAILLNPRGNVLVQTAELPPTDLDYHRALDTPGKTHLKSVFQSPITGKVQQAVSVTVPDDPRTGTILGVLAFRLNVNGLQKIMADHTGLGETGEVFLVNSAGLMVTQARLTPENTVLKQAIDSPAVRQAIDRKDIGQGVFPDYRGVSVVGAYAWLPRLNLALVAKTDATEAFDLVRQLGLLTACLVGAVTILVLGIAYRLSNRLTRQAESITETVRRIDAGDLTARAEVMGQDELSAVAASLNAMLDNNVGLIQSRDERDAIQRSIQKLLMEISGVAEGDLTKEAEVTADVTGAIADSFNFMIEQLRRVISSVQETTREVTGSANGIHNLADQLVQGSEGQAHQIVATSAAVETMAGSIRQVAENADRSARVAAQALASARRGAEAVRDTIGGMGRIRGQVQETAKRIKRLGESSQQIGEIVQLIDDIADRTSILALNASIQAAMAGEAGRGFAVVAGEVERLAERSAGATKKIAGLVKNIQGETNEAVTAMEEGTREVVEGSRLADQAGQALARIETVSTELAALIESISAAAGQQAVASEDIAQAMGDISAVTQRTAAGTRQAAISVNHLASLADELRASVSTFRLPGSNGRGDFLEGKTNGRSSSGPVPSSRDELIPV
jgi:methyl-accepting chemotaxis protein